MFNVRAHCGNPPFTLSSLFTEDKSGGVFQWFEGQKIHPSANARAAIRKACELLSIGVGDEILAPAYNCGSEIDPLIDCGADVCLYRVNRDMTINLSDVERRITKRTKAVYVTHYFGFPQPEIESLARVCRKRGLYLIEDCALSLFSQLNGRKLGTFGDLAVFCFYKFFPTIGGGALVVNNSSLTGNPKFQEPVPAGFVWRAVMRSMLAAFVGSSSRSRVKKFAKRYFNSNSIPQNADRNIGGKRGGKLLPDMPAHYYFNRKFRNASISRLTSRALGSFSVANSIQTRRENFQTYLEVLQAHEGVISVFNRLPDGVCPLSFPVLLEDRDYVCEKLIEIGISVTPWWKGFHKSLDWEEFDTERMLKERVLALPLHQYMDRRHITYICQQIHRFCSKPGPMRELA